MDTHYNYKDIETKWTDIWPNLQKKLDSSLSEPNNFKTYAILQPPPNATEVLHLGHALTIH